MTKKHTLITTLTLGLVLAIGTFASGAGYNPRPDGQSWLDEWTYGIYKESQMLLVWLDDWWATFKRWCIDTIIDGYQYAANYASEQAPWLRENLAIASKVDAMTGNNLQVVSYWLPGFYEGVDIIMAGFAIAATITAARWVMSFIPASNQ